MHKLSYKSLLIIFFFLLIGIIVLWKFVLPKQIIKAAWWNDSWNYRKAISISNNSGSNLTDFQVSLSVGTSALVAEGKMQSDCDDIRVTDINGNLLPYWIEENNPGCNQITDTKIWIKASSLPTSGSTVFLYYGNTTASNNENGKNVFLEFDNFNNPSTINNWILESNPATTFSIAGGTMAAITASGDYSSAVFGSNYTDVIVNSRFTVNTNQSHGGFIFRSQTAAADNSYQWIIREGLNDNRIQKRLNSGQTYLLGGTNGIALPTTLTAGNWYPVEFRLSGTQVDTYFNNQQAINGNFADTGFSSGKIGILSYDGSEYFDYIFVRKYASTTPTSALQSEEIGGGPIAYWKFDNNELGNGFTLLNYTTINNDPSNGYLNSINTGVLYNNATKLEFTAKSTDITGSIVLVSGYLSANSRAYPCILGGNITASSFTTATLTPPGVTRAQFSDGTIRTFALDFTSSSTDPISFGSWSDSSWSRTVDWYSFKIWNNNTLVRNFVPAKRNSDNVIGFYDTVNNIFYTNASTGNFTSGNEIIYDSISNQNSGILGLGNSAPALANESQCISGKCLQFNGSNHIKNNNTSLSNVGASANLTISAWIKPTNTTGTIFNKGLSGVCFNYGLRISGGNLLARNTNSDYNLGGNIITNSWQYVTIVYSNSGAQGYVNGKPINSNGSAITSNCTSNQWIIGARAYNALNSENFNGLIDELKIYPYARTADQIKLDYNSRGSKKGSTANLGIKSSTGPSLNSKLFAYYKFDNNLNDSISVGKTAITLDNVFGYYNSNGKNNQTLDFTVKESGSFIYINNNTLRDSTKNWTTNQWAGYQFAMYYTGTQWCKDTIDSNTSTDIVFSSTCNSFAGSKSYIIKKTLYTSLPLSGHSTNAISASLWFKSNGSQSSRRLARMTNEAFNITLNNNSVSTGINTYNSQTSYTSNPNDQKWHQIIMTYDGSIEKLYYDSVMVGTYSTVVSLNSGGDLTIAARNDGVDEFFNGYIDEVKIYNTALNDDEVKQDYNQGSAIYFGSTTQTIGGTTSSLEYCIPGDTSFCNSPIAEWKMDEKIGTSIVDTSGNNYTGTAVNTNWTQGKIGAALKLNGESASSYISTQSPTNTLSSYTAEAWINANSIIGTGERATYGYTIMAASADGSRYPVWITLRNGEIRAATFASALTYGETVGANIQPNKWYHIAVSATQNSTAIIYINGVSKTSFTASNTAWNPADKLTIGDLRPGRNISFNGNIDQIKIYDYARTPAQIAYDYNKGAPVGWWKFDECQGNTVYDWSGIGNTGAIIIGASGSQTSLGTCQIGTSAAWTNGATGKNNSSLSFDGSDDYVNIPNNSIFDLANNNYSINLWFKASTIMIDNPGMIIQRYTGGSPGAGYWIAIQSNKVYFENRADGGDHLSITSNSSYNDNLWHQVTITVDISLKTAKMYIDGNYIKSDIYTGNLLNNNANLTFGGQGTNYSFSGQLDDVRIYNYALTSEQIKTVYNNGAVNFN